MSKQESSFKLGKMSFHGNRSFILGHKISEAGLEVDQAKVAIIKILFPPIIVKGIRSYLGHVGFYRRFINDFSKISRP